MTTFLLIACYYGKYYLGYSPNFQCRIKCCSIHGMNLRKYAKYDNTWVGSVWICLWTDITISKIMVRRLWMWFINPYFLHYIILSYYKQAFWVKQSFLTSFHMHTYFNVLWIKKNYLLYQEMKIPKYVSVIKQGKSSTRKKDVNDDDFETIRPLKTHHVSSIDIWEGGNLKRTVFHA